ncbi:DUF4233 domain-containing protein [Terracoccus luteus]|uniref:DUF4233 domain-containing protein n=1 Tax=Terracoccus luteus TaxID=53356 RepID=A0A839PNQ8_9MICO|nr:DUF4233 domain-containing protein [Terracoccus luteus]MBB2985147.1 hypothetical protein [Terracoccus luteus]MCP2170799.1 hypothetical protein [Terracoccus luteus]
MRGLVFHGTLGKFTWRMLATVLGGQALVLFFATLVARSIAAAQSGGGTEGGTAQLVIGCGVALLAVVAAGTVRRPWGVSLGWAVQALTLLGGLFVQTMVVVGVVFLALWVTCLVQGDKVDRAQAAREAQWAADEATAGGTDAGGPGPDGTGPDGTGPDGTGADGVGRGAGAAR